MNVLKEVYLVHPCCVLIVCICMTSVGISLSGSSLSTSSRTVINVRVCFYLNLSLYDLGISNVKMKRESVVDAIQHNDCMLLCYVS